MMICTETAMASLHCTCLHSQLNLMGRTHHVPALEECHLYPSLRHPHHHAHQRLHFLLRNKRNFNSQVKQPKFSTNKK